MILILTLSIIILDALVGFSIYSAGMCSIDQDVMQTYVVFAGNYTSD